MEGLSKEAVEALVRLEGGARFNCIHSTARELISAGMAFDGWGALEITETGRRVARMHRGEDDRMSTPANSHEIGFELLPVAPVAFDGVMRGVDVEQVGSVTCDATCDATEHHTNKSERIWERDRVRAAAGVANSKCGVWIEAVWVEAFMDAYEEM